MIQITIKLFTISHNPNIRHLIKVSYLKTLMKVAELRNQALLTVQLTQLQDLGKLFQLIYFLRMLTGEIWMVEIICHGPRINTFQDTAAHVGLKEQQVLSLTDSTF